MMRIMMMMMMMMSIIITAITARILTVMARTLSRSRMMTVSTAPVFRNITAMFETTANSNSVETKKEFYN